MKSGIERLARARDDLDRMRSTSDVSVAREAFEAGLDDARSAYLLARRQNTSAPPKRTKGARRKWWAEQDAAGREDELISWAWDFRNQNQHGSETGETGSASQLHQHYHLGHFNADDVRRPPGWETSELIGDGDGLWLYKDRGTTRERRMRPPLAGTSAQLASQDRPVMHLLEEHAPKSHLGQSIGPPVTMAGLLELVIEWTQDVIDEAHNRWQAQA